MASGVRFTGDWKKAEKRIRGLNRLLPTNLDRALKASARELKNAIVKTIDRGDPLWPLLASVTVQRKGHAGPLREYGDLRNIIADKKIRKLNYFIGVDVGKTNRFGRSLVKIMAVQEYGAVIRPKRVTRLVIPLTKQAREMAHEHGGVRNIPGIFRPKGKNVLSIKDGASLKHLFALVEQVRVPPRAVLEPTMRRNKQKIVSRINRAIKDSAQGKRFHV